MKMMSSPIHPVRKGKPTIEGEDKAIHDTLFRGEIKPRQQEIEKLGVMKKTHGTTKEMQ
jgi:hypothetical protein